MAMYVRVKRRSVTYFLHCDPSDTAFMLKQKLQILSDHPLEHQRLTLVASNAILEDRKTLAEQKMENDAVLALTLKLSDSGGWEEICIDKPADQSAVAELEGP
eukprot:TRINITY_DN6724_c0_g1_i1.p1 TRINITY_DN6724_c0_g1~~TRINITY_DN6724_c0_g1_i1.p1  ORF type:complete len:117 (+),score=17.79 TRINITY_DN6724_c0_g1_i1:43-351(+)